MKGHVCSVYGRVSIANNCLQPELLQAGLEELLRGSKFNYVS